MGLGHYASAVQSLADEIRDSITWDQSDELFDSLRALGLEGWTRWKEIDAYPARRVGLMMKHPPRTLPPRQRRERLLVREKGAAFGLAFARRFHQIKPLACPRAGHIQRVAFVFEV